MKSFEYTGVWWTEEQLTPIPGTISFSGGSGAVLNLNGSFGNFPFRQNEIQVVWGIAGAGKPITLTDCYTINYTRISSAVHDVHQEKYRVSEVYVGTHFKDETEIRFQKLYIGFNYLSQWVNSSGLEGQRIYDDQQRFQGFSATYIRPETISSALPDGDLLSFVFGADLKQEMDTITLRETKAIRIFSPEGLYLHECLRRYVSPLQNLLTLATLRPNSITELCGVIEETDQEHNYPKVEIFFQSSFHEENDPVKLRSDDVLFRLNDVRENLQDVITNWLKVMDELEDVLGLFFSVYYQRHKHLEERFIDIAKAAEVYYNIRYDKKPNFREKIGDLLGETDDVMSRFIDNRDTFAGRVVDTRNYYTHYDTTLQDKAARGKVLYWLTEVLIIMMQRCLLKELGVPSEKCVALFGRNHRYKDLKNHMF